MSVTIGQSGLSLVADGKASAIPLLGGCLHPFAIRSTSRERVLDSVMQLGVTLLQISVPWSLHERAPNQVTIGAGESSYDLTGWIEAAGARGLSLIVDVGPIIDSELDRLGLPDRVFDSRDTLALGPHGDVATLPLPPRLMAIPSLASERFIDMASGWLSAIGAALSGYFFPTGPIVAFRIDHSLSSFYRTDAYDLDYHPQAIVLYREYLANKYPAGLPAAYKGSLSSLCPPTAFITAGGTRRHRSRTASSSAAGRSRTVTPQDDELIVHLDWVAFKEQLSARQLRRLCDVLREVDNVPPILYGQRSDAEGSGLPTTLAEGAADVSGLDVRLLADQPDTLRRTVCRTVGSSRLACITRLDWGGPAFFAPPCLQSQRQVVLRALMYGVHGLLFDSLVAHDRWVGAPIARDGHIADEARFEATRELLAFARDHALWSGAEKARVALLELRDYRRLACCTSLVSPLSPLMLSLLGLGPEQLCSDDSCGLSQPIQRVAFGLEKAIEDVLQQAQIPLSVVTDDVAARALSRFDALIVPLFDFIDADLLVRLSDFVASGGAIFCGPRLPHLLRDMQPLDERHFPPHARFDEPAELVTMLRGREIAPRQVRVYCDDGKPIPRMTIRSSSDPARVLFFLDNTTTDSRHVRLEGELDGIRPALWDALSGVPLDANGIALEPMAVRVVAARRTP